MAGQVDEVAGADLGQGHDDAVAVQVLVAAAEDLGAHLPNAESSLLPPSP